LRGIIPLTITIGSEIVQCKKCKQPVEEGSKFCSQCGHKLHEKSSTFKVLLFLFVAAIFIFIIRENFTENMEQNSQNELVTTAPQEEAIEKVESPEPPSAEDEKTRVEIIEEAQQTVYTVFTDRSQGSGFLYDEYGFVVTNAHVLEGSLDAIIKTKNGEEYTGSVIGYSNETDVAVIEVPALQGEQPYPIEKTEASSIGQEVIALGTPLGLENTATMGYITGTERDLIIPTSTFTYENIYQISAPIEPGNSGGPLVSIQDEKIIAINSAKSLLADGIGFSIPVYQVTGLIDSWIENPMSEDEIYALFYNEYGDYYFDYLWSFYDEFYFDGGDFTDDEEYYDDWDEYEYDEEYYYDWDEYEYDEEYYYDWDEYEYDEEYYYDWDEYEYDEEYYYDWDE